jgi:hypothetical protein
VKIRIAATAIFLLTVAKMAWTIAANPIIAYGNNYDFIRQESCVGVWVQYPDRPKTERNFERAEHHAIYDGEKLPNLCVHSVDNVYPSLVAAAHRLGSRVDLRELGAWRALSVAIAFGLLLFSVDSPIPLLGLSLVFLFVFGDIAYLSYFNTFYNEGSILAGCALALAAAGIFFASAEKPRRRVAALASLGLLWLGLSKLQYSPLAAILGLLLAWIVFRRWRAIRLAVWFAGLGLAIPLSFRLMNPTTIPISSAVDQCNTINAIFWGVLPSAPDRPGALRLLGLPQSCESAIGLSWYTNDWSEHPPCPEGLSVNRARLIPLFLRMPRTFFAPLHQAILKSRPFHLDYLGQAEQAERRSTFVFRFLRATSLLTWLSTLPNGFYCLLVYASMLLGMVCLALLVARSMRDPGWVACPLLALAGLGGATTFYAVVSSVFGDGFSEVPKHAVCLGVGLAFQLGAAISTLVLRATCKAA